MCQMTSICQIETHQLLTWLQETVRGSLGILQLDRDGRRIGLSLKRLERNPWAEIENKYSVGQMVEGTVSRVVSFGAFVELEEGIDGLLHVSDMSWTKHIKHPSELFKKGQPVEAGVFVFEFIS